MTFKRAVLLPGILFLAMIAPGIGHAATTADTASPAALNEVRSAAGAHRLLLFGELHGTREAPALVGDLVAAYASEGPVVLALEIGAGEQDAIKRFMASDGGPVARSSLVSGNFWQVTTGQHDGRRNWDAVALIDRARRLRASGRDVAVIALDIGSLGSGDKASSEARDAAMAGRLRTAFVHLPRGRLVALTGNVHAMRTRPSFAPPQMQAPMGSYLSGFAPFSVDIAATSGAFWACMDRACGPKAVTPLPIATGPRDGDPFDFQVVLPRFTVARLLDVDRDPGSR